MLKIIRKLIFYTFVFLSRGNSSINPNTIKRNIEYMEEKLLQVLKSTN